MTVENRIKEVHFRARESDIERWKRAAALERKRLTDFARDALDREAAYAELRSQGKSTLLADAIAELEKDVPELPQVEISQAVVDALLENGNDAPAPDSPKPDDDKPTRPGRRR